MLRRPRLSSSSPSRARSRTTATSCSPGCGARMSKRRLARAGCHGELSRLEGAALELGGSTLGRVTSGTQTSAHDCLRPMPESRLSRVNDRWMGAGKTYAKNQFIKKLVTNSPQLRTLDVDCNRLYSISNAASLEEVAVELRARSGYGHVTAVGQHGQTGALCFALGPQLLPTYHRRGPGLGCSLHYPGREPQPLIPHSGSRSIPHSATQLCSIHTPRLPTSSSVA